MASFVNNHRQKIVFSVFFIAAASILLSLFLIVKKNANPSILGVSVVIAVFSTWAAILLLKRRCQFCGALFTSKIQSIDKKEEKNEPYAYYSQILQKKDGTEQPILSSRKVAQRRKRTDCLTYQCSECERKWTKDKSYYLDSPPLPKIIYEK